MKNRWLSKILGIHMFFLLNSCCRKEQNFTNPTSFEILTSNGSKTWKIEKLLINDTIFNLNVDQLKYTKTYFNDSNFLSSDGISGKFIINNSGKILQEKITLGGTGLFKYNIEYLNSEKLIIRLVDDGSTKPVNYLYYYNAK